MQYSQLGVAQRCSTPDKGGWVLCGLCSTRASGWGVRWASLAMPCYGPAVQPRPIQASQPSCVCNHGMLRASLLTSMHQWLDWMPGPRHLALALLQASTHLILPVALGHVHMQASLVPAQVNRKHEGA